MVTLVSLLKSLTVWLTIAASFFSCLPQYRCLCLPNLKQNRLLVFPSLKTCCCSLRDQADPEQTTSGKIPLRKCCQEAAKEQQAQGTVAEKQVSKKPCKKELVKTENRFSSDDRSEYRVLCLTTIWSLPLQESAGKLERVVFAGGPSPPGRNLSPIDRVISYRHLVI